MSPSRNKARRRGSTLVEGSLGGLRQRSVANARRACFAASLSRLRSSHPFGTLWLDPTAPISIQAALLPAPGGVAEVPLAVGPAPVLQGLQFTVQGLVLTPDLSWAEFTNPLTLTIR